MMTPRHAAQQNSIALNGRPLGVCLHICQGCGNALLHVGLSHFCSDCERFVALPGDDECVDAWCDQMRRFIPALRGEIAE